MFCPKCGSNQGDSKKFCTVCGTNLLIVSQALTGQLTPPQPIVHALPPVAYQAEFDRHKETRKGITMTVLAGSYLIYQIVNFIFSAPFTGWRSPFGFTSVIAFIVFAVGLSKIISARVLVEASPPSSGLVSPTVPATVQAQHSTHAQSGMTRPQPVFSAASTFDQSAPRTNELEPAPRLTPVVTEEETKHLTR